MTTRTLKAFVGLDSNNQIRVLDWVDKASKELQLDFVLKLRAWTESKQLRPTTDTVRRVARQSEVILKEMPTAWCPTQRMFVLTEEPDYAAK